MWRFSSFFFTTLLQWTEFFWETISWHFIDLTTNRLTLTLSSGQTWPVFKVSVSEIWVSFHQIVKIWMGPYSALHKQNKWSFTTFIEFGCFIKFYSIWKKKNLIEERWKKWWKCQEKIQKRPWSKLHGRREDNTRVNNRCG